VKLFKEALFNRKTLKAALAAAPVPTPDQIAAAGVWAANARDGFFKQNESQLEQRFNGEILQAILGYRPFAGGEPGNFKPKVIIGPREADVAIGSFDATSETILAPVELKGPKVELDKIMPGRAKTPVQQAWEYAADAPGARWVLVSNMVKLRLYAFGMGTARYEEIDLDRLDDPETLKLLILLFSADNLLGTGTANLLKRSESQDKDITNQLYRDYRDLRVSLLQFLADQRPHIAVPQRVALVQKLLDRLVFIAYAEDTVLLPDDRLHLAITHRDPFFPRPRWDNLKALFAAVDVGNDHLGITGYNGGLFAHDPDLDALDLPDHIVESFLKLAAYDFQSEVSVTILGHLFEQTISDIEADLMAPDAGAAPDKKKRHGIVYTPEDVTRFIVSQTIGRHVAAIDADLRAIHVKAQSASGDITWANGEAAYWQDYLARLDALTIIDPACGSGHFLVAAFDYLSALAKTANDRLRELDPLAAMDTAAQNARIITRNLFGVDLNPESVEITKLSLWLKTAQPRQPLTTLDGNIKVGNSVVSDPGFDARAFDWAAGFPAVMAAGGFDIVIGNPPYVRMEFLKPIKPHLEQHFAVASDRADLYAYFFELGLRLLKPGGRLGFISSSTFFRTGSGAPLRDHLSQWADLECVIDFGDAQLFEGVTTYPAILTMMKRAAAGEPAGDLDFLNLKTRPDDLPRSFDTGRQPMPRARLSVGGWRFEDDRLAELRARLAAGRQTLGQVYGPPLYGIKTGLNDAFVLSRHQRDALVARDPASADLLKPFLIGENLKRWHVDSDDLWLIYTPKNRVDINAYPAIRDHLAPFRERLEARATKQNWWELQQAQAAYEPVYASQKVVFQRFQNRPMFALNLEPAYINNALWAISGVDGNLVSTLNSKFNHFFLVSTTTVLSGGYYQIQAHQIKDLPLPSEQDEQLSLLSGELTSLVSQVDQNIRSVHRRLGDLHESAARLPAFADWPRLDFAGLRALLVKRCKTDIPVGERDQWERYLAEKRAEVAALAARIADAEAEINDRVYRLFALSRDDIALIEDSIAGHY
jgi:type I restriction-modification system DNA methylase subunit